jgi:hypothetical protein
VLSALAAVMPRWRHPTAAAAAGYAAFMSYSHATDGWLAPRLQDAVEKAAQAPSQRSRGRSRTATMSGRRSGR